MAKYIEFSTPALKEKFQNDILDLLTSTYTYDGKEIQGQAQSYLCDEMRSRGWKNIGSDFESFCSLAGFDIVVARNNRGQKARVVTL